MSTRGRLPIGRGKRIEDSTPVEAPDSTPHAKEVVPEPAARVRVVMYDDEILGRQTLMRRFKRTLRDQFEKRVTAMKVARRKPGFKARMLTFFIANVLALFMLLLVPLGNAQMIMFIGLIVIDLVLVEVSLKRALLPEPIVPADAIIPRVGLPRLVYAVNRLYGRADKVPVLKLEDRNSALTVMLEDRIRELRTYIRPTFWVGNSSGKNGKSMMSVIIASIIGRVLRQPCFVVPTMANDKTGTAGKLTGLKGKSASIRKLVTLIESGELKDPGDVFEYVFSNGDGAFVISEDPIGDAEGRYIGSGKFRVVLNFIRRASRLAVLDTGNDGAHIESVTVTGMEMAHVVILTAWKENVQGMDKLKEALDEYWRYGSKHLSERGKPVDQRRKAEDIPMTEKIEKAIVTFNAVDPEADLKQYAQHVRIGAEELAPFQGRICFVRFDEYLKYLLEGFSIDEMSKEAYLDYLLIIVLAFERAAESMGITIPDRHPAIREVGLRIS